MREYLEISGGVRLQGEVRVSGAKNSALPLMIASLLSSEPCQLSNMPDLEDIAVMSRLLRRLGSNVRFQGNKVRIYTPQLADTVAPYALVKAMRASFWVLGPLLARSRRACVALPGGDAIGTRPVDLHLRGLAQMGADINMRHGVVHAEAPGGLRGAKIELDYPSVGATHQLLMAAARVADETIIKGAAREPEVAELAQFLVSMGAMIEGMGSDTLRIVGREDLGPATAVVIGDRIEAITYLLAGALTQGDVSIYGIEQEVALGAISEVLVNMGCSLESLTEGIRLKAESDLLPVSFSTAPFPGIATDAQPLLMAALTRARGQSRIEETVFENRFGHVAEYRRLGAEITVNGNRAIVNGVKQLSGAPVEAYDIRAAAGLVLLGLVADGVSEISEIHHLDRGYDRLVQKLSSLGAQVRRVPVLEEQEVVLGC